MGAFRVSAIQPQLINHVRHADDMSAAIFTASQLFAIVEFASQYDGSPRDGDVDLVKARNSA